MSSVISEQLAKDMIFHPAKAVGGGRLEVFSDTQANCSTYPDGVNPGDFYTDPEGNNQTHGVTDGYRHPVRVFEAEESS